MKFTTCTTLLTLALPLVSAERWLAKQDLPCIAAVDTDTEDAAHPLVEGQEFTALCLDPGNQGTLWMRTEFGCYVPVKYTMKSAPGRTHLQVC